MRDAVVTVCVATAYALGFVSALVCLEVTQEFSSGCAEQRNGVAGIHGHPLRSLARRVTMQKLFAHEGHALASAGLGVVTSGAHSEVPMAAPNATTNVSSASAHTRAGFLRPANASDPREQLNIYIGVFTTAGGHYTARRRAIRDTWLSSVSAYDDLRAHFVVGKARGLSAQRAMVEERDEHNDFLELEMTDCYLCLPEKTLQFFLAATSKYNANFIVKIDDDVYLNPQRLRLAAKQWNAMPAEYIGCMKKGPVLGDHASKWFEPSSNILGREYSQNAFGSIYVVSGLVADKVIAPNAARFRRLANEDTSMGLWMLAFDVAFFDDTRLCAGALRFGLQCALHPNAVAYWNAGCTGLCQPIQDMRKAHADVNCSSPGREPLPYIPSWETNKHFEKMRMGVPG